MVTIQDQFAQALVELELLEKSRLPELFAAQRQTGRRLGVLVAESGLLTEDRYLPLLAQHVGLERVDPSKAPVHPKVKALIPETVARRHRVLPIARRKEGDEERVILAITDPFDEVAAAAVAAVLPDGMKPGWLLSGEGEMDRAFELYFSGALPNPSEPPAVRMGGSAAFFDEAGTEVEGPADPTAPIPEVRERSLSGSRLGEHQLEQRVGVAGTSELYRAKAPDGSTRLFRRLLASIPLNEKTTGAFFGEARRMVAQRHPNVLAVLEVGENEGRPYVVEEWVEGRDLERVLAEAKKRHARLPPELAYYIISQILRGLDFAHREAAGAPIPHRQLSPSRVKLAKNGQVKVSDFGVPRTMLEHQSTYHAPEQQRGQPGDAASDLYTVGLLLWELLTGTPLHEKAPMSAALALSRVKEAKEQLLELRPDRPESAVRLLEQALSETPIRRFAGQAREFLAQVDVARAALPAASADELSRFLEANEGPEEAPPRAATVPLPGLSSLSEEVKKALPRPETISATASTLMEEVKRVFGQLMSYLDRFPVPQRIGLIGLVVFVVAILPAVVVRSAVRRGQAARVAELAVVAEEPELPVEEPDLPIVPPPTRKEIAPGVYDEPAPPGHGYIQKKGTELRATSEADGEVLLWLDVGQVAQELTVIDGRSLVLIPPHGPAGFLEKGSLGPKKPLERLAKDLAFEGCEVGPRGLEPCLIHGKEQQDSCTTTCQKYPGTRCVEACAKAFDLCVASCRDSEAARKSEPPPPPKKRGRRR